MKNVTRKQVYSCIFIIWKFKLSPPSTNAKQILVTKQRQIYFVILDAYNLFSEIVHYALLQNR